MRPSPEDFVPGRHYGTRIPRAIWEWPCDYAELEPVASVAAQIAAMREEIRREMVLELENTVARRPSSQLMDELRRAIQDGEYSEEALIDALDRPADDTERIIRTITLEKTDPEKPKYVHLVQEVVDGLKTGAFPIAALVMPATVEHIKTLSMMQERMPPKSTYFYPKLLSGLVIYPHQ